ncbi:MAG: response regulator transcription factor [Pseudolabrys sp.]
MGQPVPPNATGKPVVIVDDDVELLEICRIMLSRRGFAVWASRDGEGIPALVEGVRPDCVVLDLMIPGVTGFELLDDVVGQHPDVPVIVLSGAGSIGSAVTAMKHGAADFVEKPVSIDELVNRIDAVTATRAAMVSPVDTEAKHAAEPRRNERMQKLTEREHEILLHVTRGASSKEVGRLLGISPRTVDVHRARIKEKLNVRRAIDLVRVVYDLDGESEKASSVRNPDSLAGR